VSGAITIFLLIVLLIGVLALASYISSFLVKKAMRDVVSRFREQGATSPKKAATAEELGLAQRDFLGRMFRARDYKPQAMSLLGQKNIIRATEEGRLYLSEEELRNSPLKKFAKLQ
jgi:hypothetical protein